MIDSVFLCSPTNSQLFTTCCRTAICEDQKRCPRCDGEIWPETQAARWSHAFKKQNPRAWARLRGGPETP